MKAEAAKVKKRRNYKVKRGVCPRCAQRLDAGVANCPVCDQRIPKHLRNGAKKATKKKKAAKVSMRNSVMGIYLMPGSHKVSGGLPSLGKRR